MRDAFISSPRELVQTRNGPRWVRRDYRAASPSEDRPSIEAQAQALRERLFRIQELMDKIVAGQERIRELTR